MNVQHQRMIRKMKGKLSVETSIGRSFVIFSIRSRALDEEFLEAVEQGLFVIK